MSTLAVPLFAKRETTASGLVVVTRDAIAISAIANKSTVCVKNRIYTLPGMTVTILF